MTSMKSMTSFEVKKHLLDLVKTSAVVLGTWFLANASPGGETYFPHVSPLSLTISLNSDNAV